MKSEFNVRMQYHRETGIVASPDEIYCPECDEVVSLSGQVAVDERYYEWLIEKLTSLEPKKETDVSLEDIRDKVNDEISNLINQLEFLKL